MYLFVYPAIECVPNNPYYSNWLAAAVLVLIWLLAFPVALWYINTTLYTQRALTHISSNNFHSLATSSTVMHSVFRVSFACYKSKFYYWDSVVLYRRLFYLFISSFLATAPMGRRMALSVFIIILILLNSRTRPFFQAVDNDFEMFTLLGAAIISIISVSEDCE